MNCTQSKHRINGLAPACLAMACLLILFGCSTAAGGNTVPSLTPSSAAVQTPSQTPSPAPTLSPSPTASPKPTPTPVPTPTPDPDAQYYSASGEVYETNPDGRHWMYKSPTLGISIEKIRDDSMDLTYYVADIHVRDFSLFRSGFANKKPQGNPRQFPDNTARLYKAVYAQNGDYYSDRKTGLIIRDGHVYRDKQQAEDIMAISPDGEMLVFHPGTVTKDDLLGMGVTDSYAFGPILVEDGKLGSLKTQHEIFGTNPRSGFGMITKGHYIGIVVDGRRPGYSRGARLTEFAQLFLDRGCTVAYNFDGGQSSAMVFMGKPINSHDAEGKFHGQRKVPDIFFVGTSDLVPADIKK